MQRRGGAFAAGVAGNAVAQYSLPKRRGVTLPYDDVSISSSAFAAPRLQHPTLPEQKHSLKLTRADRRYRRRPFAGVTIEDYTSRYWCVKFTLVAAAHENRELQRYCGWYAVKRKVVYLDHLPFGGAQLRRQIADRMGGDTRLPALFVNKKCVGPAAAVRALEESARLKDVLQFGFLWHQRPDAGPDVHPEALVAPPSFYGDEDMFRGQYRGAPLAAPVVALPKYMPLNSIQHGMVDDGIA